MHSKPGAKPFTLATALILAGVSLAGCKSASIRMHLRDGNKLYNEQKFEEAAVEYESILAVEPEHWEANYLTAITYMAMFHPGSIHPKDLEYAARSIQAFENTLALPAPDEESVQKVRNYYLGLLTLTNRSDKAVAYLENLLREDPSNTELMGQLGTMYLKRAEYTKAAGLYETRANAHPEDKVVWYALGVLCWEHSNKGGAMLSLEDRQAVVAKGIAALERAIAIDPKYFDALSYINLIYREKATYLAEMGQLEEAQRAYATADDYRSQAMAVRGQVAPAAGQAGSS